MLPTSPPRNSRNSRNSRLSRPGRLLVECLIALVLLAVSGLTLTASTRAIASLADDAILVAHAQSIATSRAEHTLAQPCDSTALTNTLFSPRISTSATDARLGPLNSRFVDAALAPAPLSIRDTQHLSLSTARSCP